MHGTQIRTGEKKKADDALTDNLLPLPNVMPRQDTESPAVPILEASTLASRLPSP